MLDYTVYRLDKSGHRIGPPDCMTCDDDKAAIQKAAQLVDGRGIELWNGARVIILLPGI
jgi:hypothetical protein